MKVFELIELLQKEDPNMDVYIHTDHGQNYESAYQVEKEFYVESWDEIVHPDDMDEDTHEISENVIVIYS